MNTGLRVFGLLLLAALAAWLTLRGCTPEPPPAAPPAPPPREAFHASKALQIEWRAPASKEPPAWLESELRWLLIKGKMRVAPLGSTQALSRDERPVAATPFVLRISWADSQAHLALVAPDGVVERETTVDINETTRLQTVRALAAQLPELLDAPDAAQDWSNLIDFDDERRYHAFTRAIEELLGRESVGYTRASGQAARARTVERLESLVRQAPRSARLNAALALAYVSLGGEDGAALAELARSRAERALSEDAESAPAQAALGLVALRRGEWLAAHEHFSHALASDANEAAALEGLACLLTDAGRYEEARPLAQRAATLQPRNLGAQECLAYASSTAEQAQSESSAASSAHVAALRALLADDARSAEQVWRGALSAADYNAWAGVVVRASTSNRHVAQALRAVTSAASEGRIDAATEILCGAALRQAEFVFNRIARLQRDQEHAPLRLLWLPQAQFLREHARFSEAVGAAGLPAFWQEHGAPDVCASEPQRHGCGGGAAEE